MHKINEWQLQEAKNKFSEVIKLTQESGPQYITKHGLVTAIVLSIKDYQKLCGKKSNLLVFFQNSPLKDLGLALDRQQDLPRAVDL
jgi:antitoxin Phd